MNLDGICKLEFRSSERRMVGVVLGSMNISLLRSEDLRLE